VKAMISWPSKTSDQCAARVWRARRGPCPLCGSHASRPRRSGDGRQLRARILPGPRQCLGNSESVHLAALERSACEPARYAASCHPYARHRLDARRISSARPSVRRDGGSALWPRSRAECLYRQGEISVREIARREGVSEGAVRKRAKAQGCERASANPVRKVRTGA
jgi:hypothetical protein